MKNSKKLLLLLIISFSFTNNLHSLFLNFNFNSTSKSSCIYPLKSIILTSTSSNLEEENNSSVSSNPDLDLNWYSLRVISGKEKLVEENILYESKINNIEELIDEVFVPYEKVIELRGNEKHILVT